MIATKRAFLMASAIAASIGGFAPATSAQQFVGSTAELAEHECNAPPPGHPSSSRLLLTGIDGDRPASGATVRWT